MLAAMSKSDLELIIKAASFELHGRINEVALNISASGSPMGEDALSFDEVLYLHEIGILAEIKA